ncbi:hypothetical protein GCM10011380_08550 [Sphingomonas metalli]|uniref:Uncharacterized protein n=1 Tax=Sphingomonas metalli TaxID=1779358 RepID=A0A916SWR0_9SPHN|nr:hypothetical protein [Sphingomonas metalli]GGB21213.1 hypothetical protein GCM10011380_08550 [Sphingomonas metalli]
MTDAALILESTNADLPPQLADVAVLDERGGLHIPDEDGSSIWHLHEGLRSAWLPLDQPDRIVLQLLGSADRTDQDKREFEEEGFVAALDRAGLRAFIRQLQAIDAMLEES